MQLLESATATRAVAVARTPCAAIPYATAEDRWQRVTACLVSIDVHANAPVCCRSHRPGTCRRADSVKYTSVAMTTSGACPMTQLVTAICRAAVRAGPVTRPIRPAVGVERHGYGAGQRAGIGGVLRLTSRDPHHAVVDDEGQESDQHEDPDRHVKQNGAAFWISTCSGHMHLIPLLSNSVQRRARSSAGGPSTVPPPPSKRAPMSSPGGRKRPGSVGSGGTSSGLSARTSRGVINTSSSVRSLRSALLLNRCPMIGTWLSSGMAARVHLRRVVDQPGDRERLTVAQLDFGFGATGLQRRNAEPLERDAVVEIELAHFGADLQPDQIAGNRRREVETDAELLELDRDLTQRRDDRNGELAAGKEAGFLCRCRRSGSARPGSGSGRSASARGSALPRSSSC